MKLLRRTAELTTEKIAEETIVYDERTHQAHCLNRAAGFIWTHCDGRTSLEEIADRMPAALGLPPDTAIVQMAVTDLAKAGLLEEAPETRRDSSRRQMIRRLAYAGCAASALPAISSILAPTPAMARSADEHGSDDSPGRGGEFPHGGRGRGRGGRGH
jgi:hypothetical protein